MEYLQDSFVKTDDGIAIHVRSSLNYDDALPPLVCVAGMLGTVESFERELESLGPRRVITYTHRGLGRSGAIQPGQASFKSRCLDLEAVSQSVAKPFFLLAFSRGVPIAIDFALKHGACLRGLVLIDCPPEYKRTSESWASRALESPHWKPYEKTIKLYAAESAEISFWEALHLLNLPTLLVRGGTSDSLLTADACSKMQALLPRAETVVLPSSGHGPSDADYPLFLSSVDNFLMRHQA